MNMRRNPGPKEVLVRGIHKPRSGTRAMRVDQEDWHFYSKLSLV